MKLPYIIFAFFYTNFVMANNPPVIPSNDECDGAIELSLNMPIVGTTVDATRSSYLLFSNCSD
ncbi:MAG TPA: hypothetical protein PK246_10775, partial [Saprospiraceae bacterium]|nr:hypothetical protein [Saprospiraceae bacterium]